jgi:hypothetical protein
VNVSILDGSTFVVSDRSGDRKRVSLWNRPCGWSGLASMSIPYRGSRLDLVVEGVTA